VTSNPAGPPPLPPIPLRRRSAGGPRPLARSRSPRGPCFLVLEGRCVTSRSRPTLPSSAVDPVTAPRPEIIDPGRLYSSVGLRRHARIVHRAAASSFPEGSRSAEGPRERPAPHPGNRRRIGSGDRLARHGLPVFRRDVRPHSPPPAADMAASSEGRRMRCRATSRRDDSRQLGTLQEIQRVRSHKELIFELDRVRRNPVGSAGQDDTLATRSAAGSSGGSPDAIILTRPWSRKP